jgi:C-terminal processing protease CtpA/Prc
MPNGLVIEMRHKPAETGSTKKEFFVKEVVKGGLFEKIHGSRIQSGDRLVKVNDKPVEEFRSLWDINDYLKKQLKITIHVKRDGLHLEQKRQWDKAEYTTEKK